MRCDLPSAGPTRAYFEIDSGAGVEASDFFRLPFPNDIRQSFAGLDLDGFPVPGVGVLGFDPVELYKRAILSTDRAWGTDPTTFFRFSGALAPSTLRAGESIHFVDVSESAATYGESVGLAFHYSRERTRYLCDNWLGVRRPSGAPLRSGHTYAVWLTVEVSAIDGAPLERSLQFESVLGEAQPPRSVLARAWAAYSPFRRYLAKHAIDPAGVLTAAVFTVGHPERTMSELAEVIESGQAPSVTGPWVLCRDGVESPCPERSGGRACGPATPNYDEYHVLATLPSFQHGSSPFSGVEDGGGIEIARAPEWNEVCLALTAPTRAAPASGFPLVVFAHGTGGSFRSHVSASIAGALASGEVPFAVLGIDQVMHGTRRGGSRASPETLFFNFTNPEAARGNALQSGADQLSLARLALTLDGSGAEPLRIDPNRIVFLGHSQGSTSGSLALPYADSYRGAVLSGNGASLLRSLISKTKPVNLGALLPLILNDPGFDSGSRSAEFHPVLSLIQQWLDPADPLNFARYVALEPLPGHVAKHVFQIYGLGDSYSPPATLAAYAQAGGFGQVAPELEPLGLPVAVPPLKRNLGSITLGLRQYAPPSGVDGHFVAFGVPQAQADVVRFLSMAASGTTPEIGN